MPYWTFGFHCFREISENGSAMINLSLAPFCILWQSRFFFSCGMLNDLPFPLLIFMSLCISAFSGTIRIQKQNPSRQV